MILRKILWAAITALPLAMVPIAAFAEKTEVGTERSETLIVDMLGGTIANPKLMNPYASGHEMTAGTNQLIYSPLWEINTATGKMFPLLAATMPEALNDNFTKFRFKLRDGIRWSDGEPFNADDVIYTAEILLKTKSLMNRGVVVDTLKKMVKIDDLTIEVTTKKPAARFEKIFGSVIFGPAFRILPEHVFAKEDAATFDNYPPVTTGPYVLGDIDPNGNWVLWNRRSDWRASDLGVFKGKPKPKHILFRYYGPEEKRILAMAQGSLDILMDISPDGWEILQRRSKNVKAWFESFPYGNMDDPCQRGIHFNTTKAPYDKWQVRWALALAIGVEDASMNTFNGMSRISPLQAPPLTALQKVYHIPMLDWLRAFELEDGYKPFDDQASIRIANMLRREGIKGLPTNPDEIRELFGVGWWKKDYTQAAKLLESVGFSRNRRGKWLLPDGTPWKIIINAPADFEPLSGRLAFAVANEWRKFGINSSIQQMQGGGFWTSYNTGEFTVGSYWWPSSCAIAPDLFHNMETWHERYIVGNGVSTGINRERFSTPKISALIDEAVLLPSDDPKIVEIWTEVLKELVKSMPAIDVLGTTKFVPVSTTYWKNFPSADNYYEGPWWWWTQFKLLMADIEPAR